jgi:hypothetical protein
MGTNIMINLVDGVWHQSSVQTNTLSFALRVLPRGVELVRHGGSPSQLLDGRVCPPSCGSTWSRMRSSC